MYPQYKSFQCACVYVVPKVDKFTCAQTIMLILKRLTYILDSCCPAASASKHLNSARKVCRIMHIKRLGHPRAAAWHPMVCHQFTCKIGRVIYALKCVKHETNTDAASNCFPKLQAHGEGLACLCCALRGYMGIA